MANKAFYLYDSECNEVICISDDETKLQEYLYDIFMEEFYIHAMDAYYAEDNKDVSTAIIAKEVWDDAFDYFTDNSIIWIEGAPIL